MTFALGGGNEGSVLAQVTDLIGNANNISIAVSYIQLSGWELLAPILGEKAESTRILCTDQLSITDPAAVRKIQSAGVAIRCYIDRNTYHPKVYLSHGEGGGGKFIVGSANLSKSALQTSVEATFMGEDSNGELISWFEKMYSDASKCVEFDEERLARLEATFTARQKIRLIYQRSLPRKKSQEPVSDPNAEATVEGFFGMLEGEVVTLNFDQARNYARNLHHQKKILDGEIPLTGKAYSELKLLGMADDGKLNELGQAAANAETLEEFAQIWMTWLKSATEDDLLVASPTGLLLKARDAFRAFWTLPAEVTDYFREHSESPQPGKRQILQTIELLSNSGRSLTDVSLADVTALSDIIRETSALPTKAEEVVIDYLDNKGTRGWKFPHRRMAVEAWLGSE